MPTRAQSAAAAKASDVKNARGRKRTPPVEGIANGPRPKRGRPAAAEAGHVVRVDFEKCSKVARGDNKNPIPPVSSVIWLPAMTHLLLMHILTRALLHTGHSKPRGVGRRA